MRSRKAWLAGLGLGLIVASAFGCRASTAGPREVWQKNLRGGNRADAPGYTIEEQEARGRERYTIPSDARSVGPDTQTGRWSPIGVP